MTDSTFSNDLLAILQKHDFESKTGVPYHIIQMIMMTSVASYCEVFRSLEEFYKGLENEKRESPVEEPVEDHLLPIHLD